jgi:HAD superfamily hydrolase (TIGR01509 family)
VIILVGCSGEVNVPPRLVLFLDDGGVLNDNALRALQWRRLVGEFFAPRLDGSTEAWGAANAYAVAREIERLEQLRDDFDRDFAGTRAHVEALWLREMCEHVGVAAPAEAACAALAAEAVAWVIPQLRTAYPGVVETLRALHASGYRLFTASGGYSDELAGYLAGMGARPLFERLYGSDLVGARKGGTRYYPRVFEHAGIDPRDALVLDDSEPNLRLALETGARGVLVGARPPADERLLHVAALSALPPLLAELDANER